MVKSLANAMFRCGLLRLGKESCAHEGSFD
jgi:hypothetical protein